ncbi:MAG TPA: hypothetical protein VMB84_10155 [Stellaceae bacterium]|nr:hypothetical protein [Stellaceae bacterium]
MIVNLARRDGDTIVLEEIEGPIEFDGSQVQVDVLVSFEHDGEAATGRIIKVDREGGEPVIEIELVDRDALDAESEIALANLPPSPGYETQI